jgi:short-subunit dehydrogenase
MPEASTGSSRSVAVITGASSGIGAVFARKLAARGYDLLLIARREDRLRSLASELAATYRIATDFLIADLADDADLERAADRIQNEPRLGLLVNNAGFGTNGLFFDLDIRSQEQMHRLHVLATMRLTHAALANLVPRSSGVALGASSEASHRLKPVPPGVINVASVAGFAQSPMSVSYCATKAWINSFTEGVALELSIKAPDVRMQALCPGFTLSEFHDVVGLDRSAIAKSLWMSSDFVVEESLRGFERGKLFVIPGWRYKVVVAGMKLLPAALLRRMVLTGARRLRRPRAQSVHNTD